MSDTTGPGIDVIIRAQTEAAQAALNRFTGFATGTFAKLGATLAGVFSVAAMTRWVKSAIDSADAMGQMAQKTGIATEALSAWTYAAELADVNSGELQVALRTMATEMQRNGEGAEDIEEKLFTLADRFASMPDGVRKTAEAVQYFGRSGQEMIPLLNQGSAALRVQMQEAKKLGVVISSETARAADRFNDSLTRLSSAVRGAGLAIADGLLPVLNQLAEGVQSKTGISGGLDGIAEAASKAAFALKIMWDEGDFKNAWERARVIVELSAAQDRAAQARSKAQLADRQKPVSTGPSAEGFKQDVEIAQLGLTEKRLALQTLSLDRSTKGAEKLALQHQALSAIEDKLVAIDELYEKAYQARVIPLTERLRAMNELTAENLALESQRQAFEEEFVAQHHAQIEADEKQIENARENLRLRWEETTFLGGLSANIDQVTERWANMGRVAADVLANNVSSAVQTISNSLAEAIVVTGDFGAAFRRAWIQIATQFVASVIQMVLMAKVAIPVLTALGVLSGGGTAAAGSAITIGSLGAALGYVNGAFAEGGLVRGTGGPKSDSILARLSNGEYVIPAAAVQAYGAAYFDQFRPAAAGRPPGGSMAAAAEPRHGRQQINVAIVRNKTEVQEFLESREGETMILDMVSRNSHRFV